MRIFLSRSLSILLVTAFVFSNMVPLAALAQEQGLDQNMPQKEEPPLNPQGGPAKPAELINLLVGDVQKIETKNLTRVAVTDPAIVDISDVKPGGIFVVGKRPGQTQVFVWDDGGKRGITIRVAIEDLDMLKTRIQEVIDRAQIKGVSLDKDVYEGKLVLSGAITKEDKDTLDKIMEPFSDRIINLVKKKVIEDLVEIDMQIMEINVTFEKNLGIDWSNAFTAASSGNNGTTGANLLQPSYQETLPSLNGKPEDFFKIGKFYRTTPLQANVNALINEGKARILSKPRLLVLNGKEASFLVGGEIPIQNTTTSSSSTTTQTSTTFKQYGVNVVVTPTIREGKIDILLNVQISDIDPSTPITSGDVAYVTRQAQTELFLDNMQTVVLAGLIKHNDSNTVKRVAFLGNIPVIGALFRNRDKGPNKDTEVVITLTPIILKSKKLATDQVVMPSKRLNRLKNEVESNFDKEPLSALTNPKQELLKSPLKSVETRTVLNPAMTTPLVDVPDTALLPYVRDIQLRISQAISYPYEAIQKNWEGTVKLRLRILRDGSLADCDLLESSGHDIFDRDALNTAKMVAPFSPFPEQMHRKDLVVTVPIVYNQHSVSRGNTQTVVASY